MKILHLPTNVAGMPWALAQGQKKLGHEVSLLTREPSVWAYPSEEMLNLGDKNRIGRFVTCCSALLRHARSHDAYIFNFGQSLLHYPERGLNLIDLPIYPRHARKIFLYQGCDARQKYPTMQRNMNLGSNIAACFVENCYNGACNSGERDTQRQLSIERAGKYADHMFAVNPDLLYFLPKEISSFLPYTMPSMISDDAKTCPYFTGDTVHIVHAPTERGAKGTPIILRALDDVKEAFGNAVRITLIENMSNTETLRILRTADLYIDQILVGWYGGAAVEAMNMGVPTIAYINEDHLQFVPKEMVAEMPIISSRPFELVKVVSGLLKEREHLVTYGEMSMRFVRKWHAPETVARIVEPKLNA